MKTILIALVAVFISSITPFAHSQPSFFTAKCPNFGEKNDCIGEASISPPYRLAHGNGRLTEYSGKWQSNRPHGSGRAFSKRGRDGKYAEFVGEFKDGAPVYGCAGPVRTSKNSVESNSELTGQLVRYTSDEQARRYGISNLRVEGNRVLINLSSVVYLNELEAPEEKTTVQRVFQASGSALLGNTVLLGLPLIFSPLEQSKNILGCSETAEIFYGPKVGSEKVLRSRWEKVNNFQNVSLTFQLKLNDNLIEENIIFNQLGVGQIKVDDQFLRTLDPSGLVKLHASCKNCINDNNVQIEAGAVGSDLLAEIKNSYEQEVNFSEARLEAIVQEQNRQRLEAEARQKKIDEGRRIAAEKERIAREGDGTEGDLACKKRRLKPTTEAYIKCREALIKEHEKQMRAVTEKDEKNRLEEAKKEEARLSRQRIASGQEDRSALSDSKQKCIDLGFKPATEKFGQCVLRLSK